MCILRTAVQKKIIIVLISIQVGCFKLKNCYFNFIPFFPSFKSFQYKNKKITEKIGGVGLLCAISDSKGGFDRFILTYWKKEHNLISLYYLFLLRLHSINQKWPIFFITRVFSADFNFKIWSGCKLPVLRFSILSLRTLIDLNFLLGPGIQEGGGGFLVTWPWLVVWKNDLKS